MNYPKCPRCGEGRMVPMLVSGPSCDRACERVAPAAEPGGAYKFSVGDRVKRSWSSVGGTVSALAQPGEVQVLWDDGRTSLYYEDSLAPLLPAREEV